MDLPGLRVARSIDEAISVEDMRAYELNGVYHGIPLLLMMENAGRSVADYVEYRLGSVRGKKIIVLAGKGGNGGDGFVAARHLAARGASVEVHLAYPPSEVEHEDAKLNLKAIQNLPSVKLVKPFGKNWLNLDNADAVIDALLGTGVRGPLRGSVREAAKAFNSAPGLRVAVDVPTGVDPDTGIAVEGAVRADATVTMHKPKKGLFKAKIYTGEIIIAEIGLTRDAEIEAGPGDVIARIPKRPKDAHKGSSGRVLIIAGSKYYIGAPLLASEAAARTGVDLVYLVAPKNTVFEAASRCSTIIPVPLKGDILTNNDYENIQKLLEKIHAILIGPGIGVEEETLEVASNIIIEANSNDIPIVVDADALKAINKYKITLKETTILTPHRGEASMLAGKQDNYDKLAREIARKYNATTLVKGPTDYACNPKGKCRINKTGTPAMSVGGTGDVLAGVITGILAKRKAIKQNPDPLNTAITAAFINGKAGEQAYQQKGEALTAADLIQHIPTIIKNPLNPGNED